MKKLYLIVKEDPWVTWPVLLENALVDYTNKIQIVRSIYDADVVFIDYDAPIEHHNEILDCIEEKEIILYFPSIDNSKLEEIASRVQTFHRRAKKLTVLLWEVLFDCIREKQLFGERDWAHADIRIWSTPPRVNKESAKKYQVKNVNEKTMNFVSVLDAADPKENAETLCKAFLAAASRFDDITTKLHIISPTELPFAPFNNISFEGLVPVPKMLKLIASSKYYIYCSDEDASPTRLLEACHLGTPIISYSSRPEYKQTEESFSKKIEDAMLVTLGSPEYEAAIKKDRDNLTEEYLESDQIHRLIHIINEE